MYSLLIYNINEYWNFQSLGIGFLVVQWIGLDLCCRSTLYKSWLCLLFSATPYTGERLYGNNSNLVPWISFVPRETLQEAFQRFCTIFQ